MECNGVGGGYSSNFMWMKDKCPAHIREMQSNVLGGMQLGILRSFWLWSIRSHSACV